MPLPEAVVGIDEVGRGSWAGPVVAAAVLLVKPVDGLCDSKLLSGLQRRNLAGRIQRSGARIGIGWIGPAHIDEAGINHAISQAMAAALVQVGGAEPVIIDGHINFLRHLPRTKCLIKADGSVPAVSAASIIAKVARDRYMKRVALRYPSYGFERHVGYGTAEHRMALGKLGTCALHRLSYRPVQTLRYDHVD